MPDYSKPEPLGHEHDLSAFSCGEPPLDEFLKKWALQRQRAHGSRTYVVHEQNRVVAYYSLTLSEVQVDQAPPRVAAYMGGHAIPVVLLGRLAVDVAHQGQGLGPGLLRDAMVRAARVSEEAGARALLVHAKHEKAAAFYRHFDFEPSPTNELHLFLLMKDLLKLLHKAGLS